MILQFAIYLIRTFIVLAVVHLLFVNLEPKQTIDLVIMKELAHYRNKLLYICSTTRDMSILKLKRSVTQSERRRLHQGKSTRKFTCSTIRDMSAVEIKN